jgi:serine/threonine protein kinase
MQNEIQALTMLQSHPHVNVGSLIAFSERHMQLVLPYYACDLLEYITTVGCLPEPKAKIIFKQMAEGLKHCHSLQIAHGDVKPENFMLKTFPLEGVRPYNPVVVLIDFGGAGTADRSSKAMCISIRYAAPELCRARQTKRVLTLSEQMTADNWSMGVSLFCMLHKFLPYAENRPLEDLEQGQFGSEMKWVMSARARALVRGLMEGNTKTSLSMVDVLQHFWFIQDKQTWIEWGLSALY